MGVPGYPIAIRKQKGICKVNIATELKIPMANAIKGYLRPILGERSTQQGVAKDAVKQPAQKYVCAAQREESEQQTQKARYELRKGTVTWVNPGEPSPVFLKNFLEA